VKEIIENTILEAIRQNASSIACHSKIGQSERESVAWRANFFLASEARCVAKMNLGNDDLDRTKGPPSWVLRSFHVE
jgi:hypothetical protein